MTSDSKNRRPIPVKESESFLAKHHIWYRAEENPPVTSCRDAADKRIRLGKRGIPLSDELKSFVGLAVLNDGVELVIIAHCRADRNIEFDTLQRILDCSGVISRLNGERLSEMGFGYGLVHPFLDFDKLDRYDILHIFDTSLFENSGLPGTMMTNLGDRCWGVEFYIKDLVNVLPSHRKRVESFTLQSSEPSHPPKSIGIITGNSPESGMVLWRYINEKFRRLLDDEFLGDISFPEVTILSLPAMGLSMELEIRSTEVWKCISHAVEELTDKDIKVIGLACQTTQYFSHDIKKLAHKHGAIFVDANSSLEKFCERKGLDEFAFIGGRQAASFGPWSAFRELPVKFHVEKPSKNGTQFVHDLAYEIKREGPTVKGMQKLRQTLRREFTSNSVIIALTELSTLLEAHPTKSAKQQNLFDLLEIVAHEMVSQSLKRDF